MFRITKAEKEFFEMFYEMTNMANKAAIALDDLIVNYKDVSKKIEKIERIEHDCDLHTHHIMKYLNASFITPIDREDIYLIAKELDNIVDAIEAIAHRFDMYNVTSMRPEALVISKQIIDCTEQLKSLMLELNNMKRSKSLKQLIIEVNRIENEGDNVYRAAMKKLFAEEQNALDVIKWKGIFEYLEKALDACEDVANIVEGVVMKHA